jgi:hypothetical protein
MEKNPDPGWKKIRIRDEQSRSFSESLEKVFRVKNTEILDADPVSGIFLTLDPDPG